MEPRIQYAKTSDGLSIAYTEAGRGAPLLVSPPPPFSRIMRSRFGIPDGYADLAQELRHITYDPRGCGHSERDVRDFSLDRMVLDIEAVAAATGVDRFAVCALDDAAPIAIAYAAHHPEQLSGLIILDGWAQQADINQTPVSQVEAALRDRDCVLYTETMSRVLLGLEGDLARAFGAYMRACVEPDTLRILYGAAFGQWDVTAQLPRIAVPTLVLQSVDHPFQPVEAGRRLAAAIPGALFAELKEPYRDRHERAVPLIREFLGIEAPQNVSERLPSGAVGLRTVLFTDLTSSTSLTQRLGDSKAQELVRVHNAIVRQALAAGGGTEIKHTGDGIMASFPTASGALECAIAIQRAVDARGDANLSVHIGLNAGEPVAEEADLFGTSVQLARRICDHARSGEILASNVVRELSAGKGFLFADIGEVVPKGFDEAVRLYEVSWREKA